MSILPAATSARRQRRGSTAASQILHCKWPLWQKDPLAGLLNQSTNYMPHVDAYMGRNDDQIKEKCAGYMLQEHGYSFMRECTC